MKIWRMVRRPTRRLLYLPRSVRSQSVHNLLNLNMHRTVYSKRADKRCRVCTMYMCRFNTRTVFASGNVPFAEFSLGKYCRFITPNSFAGLVTGHVRMDVEVRCVGRMEDTKNVLSCHFKCFSFLSLFLALSFDRQNYNRLQ